MSTDTPPSNEWSIEPEVVDKCHELLSRYYEQAVLSLADNYPTESHLTIDWSDLYAYDPDLADDYLDHPEQLNDHFREALADYDATASITPTDVSIRMVGLNDREIYDPLGLKQSDPDGYTAVTGTIAKVTVPKKEFSMIAYECERCGAVREIEQTGEDVQKPHECQGCERKGPFRPKYNQSDYRHYCKIRIETPPDERGDLQSQHIDGFVRGDLVWSGHDEHGLVARSGDRATVYGTIERHPTDGNGRLFDEYLDADAIEFHDDDGNVDIATHREAFEELAAREDAVDIFAESIAPELYSTPAWDHALELLVAYLFGAPRIDIPDGPTYRGDIHALIVSDYGMGKSMVNENVALFSPDCIKESATGLSSDVGLLAAAVKDDFGEDQWTLKPGALVRANGGHLILDEIDKTDADLERMNDALEGEQVVDINKAGQSATYNSKVGVLATGNPEEARFNDMESVSSQLGIGQSLLSRFDGIVTMSDRPDQETDAAIAETQGMAYVEAQEYQYGDRDELDRLERTVTPEVGRAWIKHARENVYPTIQPEHIDRIKEWYAEEVRQLNETFQDETEATDMPVPVTARVVGATIRFAVAFARARLLETVTDAQVERAMELEKALVGGNFDGDKFTPQIVRSQGQEYDSIRDVLAGADDALSIATIAERAQVPNGTVEDKIEALLQKGVAYEPQTGEYKLT